MNQLNLISLVNVSSRDFPELLNFNARFINLNIYKLKCVCKQTSVDVAVITETWLESHSHRISTTKWTPSITVQNPYEPERRRGSYLHEQDAIQLLGRIK